MVGLFKGHILLHEQPFSRWTFHGENWNKNYASEYFCLHWSYYFHLQTKNGEFLLKLSLQNAYLNVLLEIVMTFYGVLMWKYEEMHSYLFQIYLTRRQWVACVLFALIRILKVLLLLLRSLKEIDCHIRILLIPWFCGFLYMTKWTMTNSRVLIHCLVINVIFYVLKWKSLSLLLFFKKRNTSILVNWGERRKIPYSRMQNGI